MIFFLRKLVEALLLPIGISCLLVLTGIILRKRLISLAGVVLIAFFGSPFVGFSMLQLLERVYPPQAVSTAPNADAIVVLSGGIVRGVNAAGVQWGMTSNRYFTGLNLTMAGKARWLVFTAANASDPKGPSQGAIMRETAIRSGIAPERVLMTHEVLTTEDEAREVSQMSGIHSVLLVTSAEHMPRAVLLFRAHGLDVSPFPTDQRAMSNGRFTSLDFIPTANGLLDSEQALREYYGLAVYHVILWSHPRGNLRP